MGGASDIAPTMWPRRSPPNTVTPGVTASGATEVIDNP